VYWRCTPTVRGALLQVPGLVDDQNPVPGIGAGVVAPAGEVVHDVVPQIGHDHVVVPHRPAQQVLHPVRGRVAGVLGQRPAVRPRQPRQQPCQEPPHPTPRLDPGEPGRDPRHDLLEARPPSLGLYPDLVGHAMIVKSPHNPG
jgi:hypothetical protein